MSASLIGRLGSSTFRLSTTAVLLSLTGSRFAEPPLYAIRLNVREVLTVYPRCALVGAALSVRMSQDVLTAGSCRTARRSDSRLLPCPLCAR